MRTLRVVPLLLVVFFSAPELRAASTPGQIVEVRTTGADTNGGSFTQGASGTDYSQQAAAQFSGTDLVIDGAVSTRVSSASHTFVASDIGNFINVASGTGFNTGFFEILTITAGAANVDRAVGTVGSTGGVWAEGGALQTIQKAFDSVSNTGSHFFLIWVKRTGTYTLTAKLTTAFANPDYGTFGIQAYDTTRGDSGRVSITTATDSLPLWQPGNYLTWTQFDFTNTAAVRAVAIAAPGFASTWSLGGFFNCTFDGFTAIFSVNGFFGSGNVSAVTFTRCEFKNSTVGPAFSIAGTFNFSYCNIHDNAGGGIITPEAGVDYFIGNTFARNAGIGLQVYVNASGFMVNGNNFTDNTSDALRLAGSMTNRGDILNNIFYNSGGYAINATYSLGGATPQFYGLNQNNAYGNNASVNFFHFPAGTNDQTLTADPWVARASNNFALNSTSGGGALLKAAGFPGVTFAGTGYLDIGALQSQAAAAGGSASYMTIQ